MNSCIYVGQVRHRRFAPAQHQFNYKLFMMYLDLDELPDLFNRYLLWSYNRKNIACFMRNDYFGDKDTNLADSIRDYVEQQTGDKPSGSIRLLTHMRYFGHIFNPVSFYYCFNDDNTLHSIVAEITNTPWKERRAYVLRADNNDEIMQFKFNKDFHVSPFNPLNQAYDWRLGLPGEKLTVHMNVAEAGTKLFDATMKMQKKPVSSKVLAQSLFEFPFMTIKVITAIYWQALRLWLKKVHVYDHPVKSKTKEAPNSVK